jgi:hypothetical protein
MPHNRKILEGLFFEKNGDLNLSQLLMVIVGIAGIVGFLYQIIFCKSSAFVVIAGWSFVGAAFSALLIAAIPISKAKILSDSKLPSDIAGSIAGLEKNVTTSTDVQELSQPPSQPPNQIG